MLEVPAFHTLKMKCMEVIDHELNRKFLQKTLATFDMTVILVLIDTVLLVIKSPTHVNDSALMLYLLSCRFRLIENLHSLGTP